MRVCEELYYHCQNDHRYVTELRAALREIGLDADRVVQKEYVLKETFRSDAFYRDGWIFLNDRIAAESGGACGLPEAVRGRVYRYQAPGGASGTDAVMKETEETADERRRGDQELEGGQQRTFHLTVGEIAAIQYAAVNKALRGGMCSTCSTSFACMRPGNPDGRSCPPPPLRRPSSSGAGPDTARFSWRRSSPGFSGNTTGT